MSASCRLRYRYFIKILSGFVFCVLLNLGWTVPGHANGYWTSAPCNGATERIDANTIAAGAELAIANEPCRYPQSNPVTELELEHFGVSASSYFNNFSCQSATTGIDQHCWGDAFYWCPMGDVRDADGWCIDQNHPPHAARNGCSQTADGPAQSSSGGLLTAGNPIEISTGRKIEIKNDWTSGGNNPLTFTRTYSSVTGMAIAPNYSRLGKGWRSNFDSAATFSFYPAFIDPTQAHEGDVISVALPDLNEYAFRFTGGTWKLVVPTIIPYYFVWDNYRTDLNYTLTGSTDKIELRTESGEKYTYDLTGKLTSITFANGYWQKLVYAGNVNTSVVDSFGRKLFFEYWDGKRKGGLLKSITGYDNNKVSYDYSIPDEAKYGGYRLILNYEVGKFSSLSTVVYPDATPLITTDNPQLRYSYWQNPEFSYALTSIQDERGVVFASWTYDAKGRATSSQHSGGDGLTTLSFDDANNKVTVTNALGRPTVYQFQQQYGVTQRLVSVDGVATTNCAASNTAYAFDANGFRNQATDAEGRITKWTRDARGLPLTTTEGFGTAAQKITSTTWDATRPLPTQIAAPGLTTNLAYNPNGLITSLSQVDTTTTAVPYSTNGQTRTTAFGYTSFKLPAPVLVPTGTALNDVPLSIINPDAELGTIAGWTDVAGALAISTSVNCSVSNKCFWSQGDNSGPRSLMSYQDITVPSVNAAEIDAGKRAAMVSWRQVSTGDDTAAMRLVFLDANSAVLGSAMATPISTLVWTARSASGPLPVGTRKIRVQMLRERRDCCDSTGLMDDISLSLVANGAASALPFLPLANADAISGTTGGWTVAGGSAIAVLATTPCDIAQCFVDAGNAAANSFSQTITLPSDRLAEVDAAKRSIELRWSDRTLVADGQANVDITFLDAAGSAIAALGTASPPTGSSTIWVESEHTFTNWVENLHSVGIPALTRRIKITVNLLQNDATAAGPKMAFTGLTARLVARDVPQTPVDLLTVVDGPLAGTGDRVVYAYDAGGNLAQVTNEVGQITKVVALDSAGRPTTTRDANSVDTKLAYDPRGRLTSITVNPGTAQAVTTITYDPAGDVTKVTQPDGSFLQYTWNDAKRLTLVSNNTGESITYTYNANGDVTSTVVKSSAAVITKQMTMVYDELGRLMTSLGAASQTTSVAYDRTDNPVQVTDPRNNLYAYAYDSISRLVRTTDQGGSQVNLTRDGQDSVVAYADPRSLVTTYVRNGFGEVIRETSPDAGVTTYVRNLRGLVTQATDGRGIVSNMTYDNAGRLLTMKYPAATAENVTYSYDSVVAPNKGIGRLTKITDQSGTTEFTYNALGQITADKRTIAGKIYTTGYLYNASGNITQITYPSGRIVTYGRNANGQVTGVTTKQTSAAAAANVATGITYKPMSSLVSSLTHGNGLVTTAGYDLDYRLSSLELKNGAAFVANLGYTYGDGMNLTAINDNLVPANTVSLWYTPASRLQNASGTWGQSTYYYDAVGNRTYDINTAAAVTKTRVSAYPASSNRVSGMTENGAALRTYTYDNAGNIVTDTRPGEAFVITYNKRNRPVSVMRNAIAYATYGYNALQQLVSRSTTAAGGPVGTIHYIYDLSGHLIAEANGATGATTRDYIWAAANDNTPSDLPLAVAEAASLYMVHTDHLGRPIRMTDATKATVWQAAYKPWGEPKVLSGSRALNLRFPGQYFQIETGLAYNWNRHYDTTTGRYTQPDPMRFVDGPSIYAYAGSSPFMRTDWDGRDTYTVGVSGTFIAGGGAEIGSGFLANFGNPNANECADFGFYFSGGPGVGLNIGVSANAGFSTGSASSIEGISLSGSVGAGYASISGSTGVGHASSTSYGGGVGVGITPVSANVNASYTYSFTYQKTKAFFNWVFGRATEECSCSK